VTPLSKPLVDRHCMIEQAAASAAPNISSRYDRTSQAAKDGAQSGLIS
jgi:hypothetical protein